MRGDDVEAAYCVRDHAAVATTAGGGQPQSETVWSRSTRGGGTGRATRKSTLRGKKLADPHRLLQHIQHSEPDCHTCVALQLYSSPFHAVTARCQRSCSFRWNREKGGRSTAPLGYNKGMPWGRRCSACRSCRC